MKHKHEIDQLLQKHKLKVTDCRAAILEVFQDSDFAISHAEIESNLKDSFDRVTIYRNLNNFLEKGLIHKIPDDSGAAKYALCDNCEVNAHTDSHVHFKCTNCQTTQCIEDIEIPVVKLPKGFTLSKLAYIAEGRCRACEEKAGH